MKNNFPEDVTFSFSLFFTIQFWRRRRKYESHGRVCKTHFIEWLPLIKFAILAWFFPSIPVLLPGLFQTVTYVHTKKKQRKKDGNGYFSFCFCNRRLISHFFYQRIPARNLLITGKKVNKSIKKYRQRKAR